MGVNRWEQLRPGLLRPSPKQGGWTEADRNDWAASRVARRVVLCVCGDGASPPTRTRSMPEDGGDDGEQPKRPHEVPDEEVEPDLLGVLEDEDEQESDPDDRRDRAASKFRPAPTPSGIWPDMMSPRLVCRVTPSHGGDRFGCLDELDTGLGWPATCPGPRASGVRYSRLHRRIDTPGRRGVPTHAGQMRHRPPTNPGRRRLPVGLLHAGVEEAARLAGSSTFGPKAAWAWASATTHRRPVIRASPSGSASDASSPIAMGKRATTVR